MISYCNNNRGNNILVRVLTHSHVILLRCAKVGFFFLDCVPRMNNGAATYILLCMYSRGVQLLLLFCNFAALLQNIKCVLDIFERFGWTIINGIKMQLSCVLCILQLSCSGRGSKSQHFAAFVSISSAGKLHWRCSEKLQNRKAANFVSFYKSLFYYPQTPLCYRTNK